MKDTLVYFSALLGLRMAATCKHLRNKAYPPNSVILQNAQQQLVYYCVLKDELDTITGRFDLVETMLKRHLQGDDLGGEIEVDGDIHTYCLTQFSGECALGKASDDLKGWVSTHAEREQRFRAGFDQFFPNVGFAIFDDSTNDVRPVTETELFNSKTEGLLKDIEMSNSLQEFNDQMQTVYRMLIDRKEVKQILIAMTIN